MHFYFACHGCSDHSQKVLLNEREVSKIFWESEEKIKQLLQTSGSNVKALVIYDCCREPFEKLKLNIMKALEIMKDKLGKNQLDPNLELPKFE